MQYFLSHDLYIFKKINRCVALLNALILCLRLNDSLTSGTIILFSELMNKNINTSLDCVQYYYFFHYSVVIGGKEALSWYICTPAIFMRQYTSIGITLIALIPSKSYLALA